MNHVIVLQALATAIVAEQTTTIKTTSNVVG